MRALLWGLACKSVHAAGIQNPQFALFLQVSLAFAGELQGLIRLRYTIKTKSIAKGDGFCFYGAPAGIRTRDPLIKSQLLYQLSYRCVLIERAIL